MNFAMWGLVGFLICLIGLAVLAKTENTRAERTLGFDCAWAGFHLCLLLMLVVAHERRVGYCAPLCVAMAMTLPFAWYWNRNLWRRWQARRRSRPAGG
jgi:hypothetical protein